MHENPKPKSSAPLRLTRQDILHEQLADRAERIVERFIEGVERLERLAEREPVGIVYYSEKREGQTP